MTPLQIEGLMAAIFGAVNAGLQINGLRQLTEEQQKEHIARLQEDGRVKALIGVSDLRTAIDEQKAARSTQPTEGR